MPNRQLERQYQLQAQKHHQDNLKKEFYASTARYFERESAYAKQFNSWSMQTSDSYKWVAQIQRAAKLEERREKLRQQLATEAEDYRREADELKRSTRRNNSMSLEELKQVLMEKKAEQSLYYTSACKRMQSYATTTAAAGKSSLHSQNQQQHVTNSTIEQHMYQTGNNNDNNDDRTDSSKTSALERENIRYAARRSYGPSLQETNLCHDHYRPDECPCNDPNHRHDENNDEEHPNRYLDAIEEHRSNEIASNDSDEISSSAQKADDSAKPAAQHGHSTVPHTSYISKDDGYTAKKHKKNPYAKSIYTGGDSEDVSVQMFKYLKHNDLKRQILDLAKRELSVIAKQSWDEALRLREMRNEVMLQNYKNLYENDDLTIDEGVRQNGAQMIEMRETINNGRAKMCNSLMYSDEAKALWKQWVQEDDEFAKIEKNAMRDLLLAELEEEWKGLALHDKNRISQLYQQVMTKSSLQDEHKLAEYIRNGKSRQYQ